MAVSHAAHERARSRLIFALDVGSLREAGELVRTLEGVVGMFKVGKQLFLKTGPRILKYIHDRGGEIVDTIGVGLSVMRQSMPSEGAECLVELALGFSRNGVKNQRRFAGAGHAREDGEFLFGNLE